MARPKRIIRAEAISASTPPESLPPNHVIAKVIGGRGNNLFAVELPIPDAEPAEKSGSNKSELLVELNGKFRNTVYLRRGGYVLVDREALNTDRDNKLGGAIVGVVMDEKPWRKMPYWPEEFTQERRPDDESEDEDSNVGKLPPMDSESEGD